MLLLLSMTTSSGKSYSFSKPCMSFVKDCQFVCASFPFGFQGGKWDLIVLTPDHCLSVYFLSHGVAVIQWIISCHKNRLTTRVITLWRERVTSLTTSMSTISY